MACSTSMTVADEMTPELQVSFVYLSVTMTYGSEPRINVQVQVAVEPFASITHGESRQNAHGLLLEQRTKLAIGKYRDLTAVPATGFGTSWQFFVPSE